MPGLERAHQVSCAWIGRGEAARPDPSSLLPLLDDRERPLALATVSQIHSSRWLRADRSTRGGHRVLGEADAILTAEPDLALGIATADCLPIVAVDSQAPALAVVHAGWRGSRAGVLREALLGMQQTFGARPERTSIGIGPGAGPCCYQVGEEVAEAFTARVVRREDGGSPRLDLVEANRLQALEAGILPGQIHSLNVCTICNPDTCHSYRRDGPTAGRMWLLASLI
ncbi:MAG: polyphenol oxidase family protein [Candidatus Polarisedimenticolia bacterium]